MEVKVLCESEEEVYVEVSTCLRIMKKLYMMTTERTVQEAVAIPYRKNGNLTRYSYRL